MSKNTRNFILISSIVLLICGVGALGFYLGANDNLFKVNSESSKTDQIESKTEVKPTENNPEQSLKIQEQKFEIKNIFSGNLVNINDVNLDLFITLGDISNEAQNFATDYYSAGKVTEGKYKGYERILGVYKDSMYPIPYFFLTKDRQSFVLLNYPINSDIQTSTALKYAKSLIEVDPNQNLFNSKKISSVDIFDDGMPVDIKLDEQFSLVKSIQNLDIDLLPKFNEKIDLSKLEKYSQNIIKSDIYRYADTLEQITSDEPGISVTSKYLGSSTIFIIPDSTGLSYVYSLSWNANKAEKEAAMPKYQKQVKEYDKYQSDRAKLEKELDPAQKGLTESQISQIEAKLGKYPVYPELEASSYLDIRQETIKLDSGEQSFAKYSVPFPGACGMQGGAKYIKEVKDDELARIGTKNDHILYKLNDKNHPLYKEQYRNKIGQYENYEDFSITNPGQKKPTFSEYVNKNPLIFFKDNWGNLVAVGEWSVMTPGGCGKPVLYFYPQKETKVNVKFKTTVQLTSDIPKYNPNLGWNIIAKPNGQLKDLQPNLTNCEQINTQISGLEYAKQACQTNNYPYLYWSGNVIGKSYPKQTQGWIVDKNDLDLFLNNKLDDLGLNANEKADMLEYWLPYLKNKSGNFYRISFIQTTELNQFMPMEISPKPDKYFRIFLDWDIYDSRPLFKLEPQILDRLTDRSGFTVVEWGGLKK